MLEAGPARCASTARREIATSGKLSASQRPLAALNPTRTPVKEPGPCTATTASSDCSPTPVLAARSLMVATRRSDAVRPGRLTLPTIADPSARAMLPVEPHVSMIRIFMLDRFQHSFYET